MTADVQNAQLPENLSKREQEKVALNKPPATYHKKRKFVYSSFILFDLRSHNSNKCVPSSLNKDALFPKQ